MLILLIFAITNLLFHNNLHLFVLTAVDKENPSIVLSNLRSSCSYKNSVQWLNSLLFKYTVKCLSVLQTFSSAHC